MSKEIKITKEHEKFIPEYLERFRAIGLNTDPCDRLKAEIAVSELFAEINRQPGYENTLPVPTTYIWFSNPFDAAEFAARIALPENAEFGDIVKQRGLKTMQEYLSVLHPKLPTREQIKDQALKASYGSFESYWVAFYAFADEVVEKKNNPLVARVVDAVKKCGTYWGFKNKAGTVCVMIMSEKPAEIHIKGETVHAVDKMAIKYPDGRGFYCIEGTPYRTLMEAKMNEVFKNKS